MAIKFDPETLEQFRNLTPQEVYFEVTQAIHQIPGATSSEDFLKALDALVDEGILTWDQIDTVEREKGS